jgi:hypothetical protein
MLEEALNIGIILNNGSSNNPYNKRNIIINEANNTIQ